MGHQCVSWECKSTSEYTVWAADYVILKMPPLCGHLKPHDLVLMILNVKRGEAAKEDLKAIGTTEEQTKRV